MPPPDSKRITRAAEPGVAKDPKFADLATEWLAFKRRTLAVQSIQRYEATAFGSVGKKIGSLSISELNNPMLRRVIRTLLYEDHASEARTARVVIKGVLAYGAERGICSPELFNFSGMIIPVPKKLAIALSPEEVEEVRRLIRVHRDTERSGPRTTKAHDDLLDFVNLALATSLRISEVLAFTTSTVDLDHSESPRVYVEEKIEYTKGAGYDLGMVKTESTERVIIIPEFAVTIIRRRLADVGRAGLIFHTSGGGPLSQNNVRRTLRECVKGSKFEWVTPHVLRKTVITVVDNARGSKIASEVAGHSSEVLINNNTYSERRVVAPDVRYLTDQFAPVVITESLQSIHQNIP
jgi:integrase